jgi:hypothetical protein
MKASKRSLFEKSSAKTFGDSRPVPFKSPVMPDLVRHPRLVGFGGSNTHAPKEQKVFCGAFLQKSVLFLIPSLKVVDAGLRRHDGVGKP